MKFDPQFSAIVTGGASGLGRASAEALVASGFQVAIFDVNAEKGEAVATDIGALFCAVDVTSEESVVAGFAKARAAHGQERVLVHCARHSPSLLTPLALLQPETVARAWSLPRGLPISAASPSMSRMSS